MLRSKYIIFWNTQFFWILKHLKFDVNSRVTVSTWHSAEVNTKVFEQHLISHIIGRWPAAECRLKPCNWMIKSERSEEGLMCPVKARLDIWSTTFGCIEDESEYTDAPPWVMPLVSLRLLTRNVCLHSLLQLNGRTAIGFRVSKIMCCWAPRVIEAYALDTKYIRWPVRSIVVEDLLTDAHVSKIGCFIKIDHILNFYAILRQGSNFAVLFQYSIILIFIFRTLIWGMIKTSTW